jgi:hypothetical protein
MVLDRVDLVLDPSRFDSETNTVEIPVGLKNTSEKPIYPPITLEIIGFHCGLAETEEDKRDAPSVLNAGNGKEGVGAAFPFDAGLRGSESLAAGALSGPIVLRCELSDPVKTPCTHFLAFGMVEEK